MNPLALVCRLSDHEWSWAYVVMLGVIDRPVCTRCGKGSG